MKKLLCLLTVAVSLLCYAQTFEPRGDGVLHVLTTGGDVVNGGTNNVPAASTNTYLPFYSANYKYVGLTLSVKATAATTGTLQLFGYQSIDSTTYETTPSFNKLITLTGTTLLTTNFDISLPAGQVFKLQLGNTNTTVAITNVVMVRSYKSPKRARY